MIVCFISNSTCSLLKYMKVTDFCLLVLLSAVLLYLLISSRSFLVNSFIIFCIDDHILLNEKFYVFLLNLYTFYFLSCHSALARTYSTVLKRSGSRGHPRLVPGFNRKIPFSRHKLLCYLYKFCRYSLSSWGLSFLLPIFWDYLLWMDIGFCQMLFLHLSIWSRDVFLLYSFDVMDYINWFFNVETTLHAWDTSYLVVVYNCFIHWCIQLIMFLWGFLHLCSW